MIKNFENVSLLYNIRKHQLELCERILAEMQKANRPVRANEIAEHIVSDTPYGKTTYATQKISAI